MCGICDIQNIANEPLNEFNDSDFDRIIHGIVIGNISTQFLDYNTFLRTARKLSEGVFKGFGVDINNTLYGSPDYNMLFDLRNNVYVFSGAKTYQQTREIEDILKKLSSSLTTGDKINTFGEFKKQAKDILVKYNENYLRTEYSSAISQSRAASQWMSMENDYELMPMLTYHTVGDGRVRPEHAILDGISRDLKDNFWNTYYPPNGWNCRCTIMQSDDAIKTSLKGFKPSEANVPDIFKFNSGKDRIVFSKEHPYFDVAQKDKKNAKNNWNLGTP
jgi:SPP1 gp7 family putative phage head morphogenesis protein